LRCTPPPTAPPRWSSNSASTADGRNPDGPLYDNASLQKGTYRLVFDVAGYFRARGVQLPDPPFLDQVSIDFGVAHTDQHYHVPLVCTPWTYSTYRGS
jgi:5-hydroxyisourate hydrolase